MFEPTVISRLLVAPRRMGVAVAVLLSMGGGPIAAQDLQADEVQTEELQGQRLQSRPEGLAVQSPGPEATVEVSRPEVEKVPSAAVGPIERSAGQVFVQANELYDRGEYSRAASLYSHLIARGLESGRLHFNLGNALLRNGELGRAIASYRRSRLRLPRDEDVAANLSFARGSAKDAISPPEPSRILSTVFFWHYGLGRMELAVVVLVVNLMFWGLCLVYLWRRESEALRWSLVVVLSFLITFGGSLAIGSVWPVRVAVIIPQELAAHTGPEIDTVVRFKLHAGTEVQVRDEREGWLRIALPDGQQGWIERERAEVVEGPW